MKDLGLIFSESSKNFKILYIFFYLLLLITYIVVFLGLKLAVYLILFANHDGLTLA